MGRLSRKVSTKFRANEESSRSLNSQELKGAWPGAQKAHAYTYPMHIYWSMLVLMFSRGFGANPTFCLASAVVNSGDNRPALPTCVCADARPGWTLASGSLP